jgi:chlorobactene glucosyltransferase
MLSDFTVFAYNAAITAITLITEQAFTNAPTTPKSVVQEGTVAVIVPARNEARNLPRTLPSVLEAAGRYGNAQVIVVDDHSTDATPEIIRDLQQNHPNGDLLIPIQIAEPLPSDWFGKPRACWTGAQHPVARAAEWLLFVDADTAAYPDAIGRLMAGAQESNADLYSVMTDQELHSVSERLVMPLIFYAIGSAFSWQKVNDPDDPLAIANGQCMLFRRSVYDVLDGHRAVRTEIAEDRAIADLVKRNRYRLYLADGRTVLTTRMYTSLPEIWEGWSKNAYLGLGEQSWLLPLIAVLGIGAGIVPFVALPLALFRRRFAHAFLWFVTILTLLRNRDRANREMKVPRWYAFTLPIGTLLCCGIAFSAWYKVVSGQGVQWKGRTYAANEPSQIANR